MNTGRPYWDFPRGLGAVRLLLEVGGERGVPARECLAGTGLSLGEVDRADHRIAAEQELRVIRNLTAATGDPAGLGAAVGVRLTLSSLGVWGLLVMSCRTIAQVIAIGPRYYQLSANFLRPSIEVHEAGARLAYADHDVPADVRGFVVERDLAYNVTSVQSMVGTATRLRITAALSTRRAEALAAVLPGFEVAAQQKRNTIELPSRILRQPLISADDETHRRCRARCDELLDVLGHGESIAARVRAALRRSGTPLPKLEELADDFNVDPRTMRRWLAEESTSYRALTDEACARRAVELMATPRITVQQAARRFGYADAASFTRAFRRWTGETPAAWRRQRDDVQFHQKRVR